jgi:5'-methylthioadenosine phosphorylase
VDLIGMTNMPEAKLAREAELPYATIALVTDYDCWRESEEAVDIKVVLRRLGTMVDQARQVVRQLCTRLPDVTSSPAHGAATSAVVTSRKLVSEAARQRLGWLLPNLGGDR